MSRDEFRSYECETLLKKINDKYWSTGNIKYIQKYKQILKMYRKWQDEQLEKYVNQGTDFATKRKEKYVKIN